MQHIGISIKDESGNLLEELDINFALILEEIYKIDDQKKSSALLWMIDPYGDTVFNALQIPILISELKSLVFSDENRFFVEKIIEFLEKRNNHEYVYFIGD